MSKDAYLTGKCLIAMPTLSDPRFHKAVIFLCIHNDHGAMGLVVNHPVNSLKFKDIVNQLPFKASDLTALKDVDLKLLSGGPVESARGFLLHSSDVFHKDTIRVVDHFGVTGTPEGLKDIILRKDAHDENMLFVLGHAAWTAGQLEAELRDHAWLVCDATPNLLFHDAGDEKWSMATQTLGFDPAWLSTQTGQA